MDAKKGKGKKGKKTAKQEIKFSVDFTLEEEGDVGVGKVEGGDDGVGVRQVACEVDGMGQLKIGSQRQGSSSKVEGFEPIKSDSESKTVEQIKNKYLAAESINEPISQPYKMDPSFIEMSEPIQPVRKESIQPLIADEPEPQDIVMNINGPKIPSKAKTGKKKAPKSKLMKLINLEVKETNVEVKIQPNQGIQIPYEKEIQPFEQKVTVEALNFQPLSTQSIEEITRIEQKPVIVQIEQEIHEERVDVGQKIGKPVKQEQEQLQGEEIQQFIVETQIDISKSSVKKPKKGVKSSKNDAKSKKTSKKQLPSLISQAIIEEEDTPQSIASNFNQQPTTIHHFTTAITTKFEEHTEEATKEVGLPIQVAKYDQVKVKDIQIEEPFIAEPESKQENVYQSIKKPEQQRSIVLLQTQVELIRAKAEQIKPVVQQPEPIQVEVLDFQVKKIGSTAKKGKKDNKTKKGAGIKKQSIINVEEDIQIQVHPIPQKQEAKEPKVQIDIVSPIHLPASKIDQSVTIEYKPQKQVQQTASPTEAPKIEITQIKQTQNIEKQVKQTAQIIKQDAQQSVLVIDLSTQPTTQPKIQQLSVIPTINLSVSSKPTKKGGKAKLKPKSNQLKIETTFQIEEIQQKQQTIQENTKQTQPVLTEIQGNKQQMTTPLPVSLQEAIVESIPAIIPATVISFEPSKQIKQQANILLKIQEKIELKDKEQIRINKAEVADDKQVTKDQLFDISAPNISKPTKEAKSKGNKKNTKKAVEKQKAINTNYFNSTLVEDIQQPIVPIRKQSQEPQMFPPKSNVETKLSEPEPQPIPRHDEPKIEVPPAAPIPSSKSSILNQLINLVTFQNDEQIRILQQQMKMLEEDIRSRMIRNQMLLAERSDNETEYRRSSDLYGDIVDENISLRQEYYRRFA